MIDHEFNAINTLLLVVTLGLCILLAYLVKENSFYYLPESTAAICIGVIVGLFARILYPDSNKQEEMDFLTFNPDLFFFLLLPPIIFEAAYSLNLNDFFANFWTISLFAVFGTIISTFVVGYLVYLTGLTGLFGINTQTPLESFMFSALISAVDPVATLSIMGKSELNCNPLLYSLIFGESVLNDAVSIVLFNTFKAYNVPGQESKFSHKSIPAVMHTFTVISVGSIAVGVAMGLICSFIGKHTKLKKYPEYEISLLFLFAYGSFSLTESLGLSGIMSLFFLGIVLSHYNTHNLSPVSQVTVHNIFKSLACLSEFFVFLYIGMGCVTGKFKNWNMIFFILCVLFCLLGRILNIYPLSFLANIFRKQNIPLKMQHVMCFAGLRGAIAFALSMGMPEENRDLYVSTTLSIVVFTTFVCGGMTEPVLKKMGMRGTSTNNVVIAANANSIGVGGSSSGGVGSSSGLSPGSPLRSDRLSAESDGGESSPSPRLLGSEADEEASLKLNSASFVAREVHNIIGDNEALAALIESSRNVFNMVSESSVLQGIRDGGSSFRDGFQEQTGSIISTIDREYMAPLFGQPAVSVNKTTTASSTSASFGSRGEANNIFPPTSYSSSSSFSSLGLIREHNKQYSRVFSENRNDDHDGDENIDLTTNKDSPGGADTLSPIHLNSSSQNSPNSNSHKKRWNK